MQIDMNQTLTNKFSKASRFFLIAVGLLVACAPAAVQTAPTEVPTLNPPEENPANSPVPDTEIPPSAAPTPTDEHDSLDFAFVPLLPKDGIRPIYEPIFVQAPESPLDDEELVMGVAIGGESKAYPVSVLRFREMVDDELGGLPILVTW